MRLDPGLLLAHGDIVLRPLEAADAARFAALAAPIAEDFVYSPTGPCDESYVPAALRARDDGTQLPFAVECAGRIVGSTRYADVSFVDAHVEIGWTWYVREARGTHVNPAAKLVLLQYAFETLGMVRVQLKCDARNAASARGIEKLGAVREGALRKHTRMRDGFLRDTVYYSLLADEWPAARARLLARLETPSS